MLLFRGWFYDQKPLSQIQRSTLSRYQQTSNSHPFGGFGLNRVNPRNGLLLSALHDKAFDVGLITINDDLTVRVSRDHAARDDEFYAADIARYDGQPIHRPEKFGPERKFLEYHTEHVFQG